MRKNKAMAVAVVLFIVLLVTLIMLSAKIAQAATDSDPCVNAVPIADLRQVQIVSRGNYQGCVNQTRLLCSLEQAQLGEYDLDNIIRHTVARMPDGTCARVNLQDATIFSYSASGQTEYSAARYIDPTRPMPPGVLTFGAMPYKRTLYVRAEIDQCDPSQGGNLNRCEQERDKLKARVAQLGQTLCQADGWTGYDPNTGKCAETRAAAPRGQATSVSGLATSRPSAQSAVPTMTAAPRGQATTASGLATSKNGSWYKTGFWTLLVVLFATIAIFAWLLSKRVPRAQFVELQDVAAEAESKIPLLEQGLDRTRKLMASELARAQSDLSIANSQNNVLVEDARKLTDERNGLAERVHELSMKLDSAIQEREDALQAQIKAVTRAREAETLNRGLAEQVTQLRDQTEQLRQDTERALENVSIANALVPILVQNADKLRAALERKKFNKDARRAVANMLELVNPPETAAPLPPDTN